MARLICGDKGSVLFCDSGETIVREKKQTNADRIRSMSDEELVDFIVGLNKHCLAGIGLCDCSGKKECSDTCNGKVKEWLQAEVKEGDQA